MRDKEQSSSAVSRPHSALQVGWAVGKCCVHLVVGWSPCNKAAKGRSDPGAGEIDEDTGY